MKAACAGCGHAKYQVHELKTWPWHFRDVQSGRKAFELRKDDRGFEVGDLLWLREFDPETQEYTGQEVYRSVTLMLQQFPGLAEGYVIMALVPA